MQKRGDTSFYGTCIQFLFDPFWAAAVTEVSIGYLTQAKKHTEEFVIDGECLREATAKKKARTRRALKAWIEPGGDQGTLAVLSMKGRPSIVKLPPNSMFMLPVACTGQPPGGWQDHEPPRFAKITEP